MEIQKTKMYMYMYILPRGADVFASPTETHFGHVDSPKRCHLRLGHIARGQPCPPAELYWHAFPSPNVDVANCLKPSNYRTYPPWARRVYIIIQICSVFAKILAPMCPRIYMIVFASKRWVACVRVYSERSDVYLYIYI
jgi:hypothetical protein